MSPVAKKAKNFVYFATIRTSIKSLEPLRKFLGTLGFGRAQLGIIGLAAALRLSWALLVPLVPVSDQNDYLIFATNLALHGVYGWTTAEPTAFYGVGTSAIYAGLFKVFGVVTWPIVAFNVVIGTTLVGFTMAASRLLSGDCVAIAAGMIMAVWPSQIMYVTVAASDIPYTFSTVIAVWCWLRTDLANWQRGVGVGLMLAIASLIRPIGLLLPVVLLVSLAYPRWTGGSSRQHALTLFIAVVVMGFCIVPWTIRNYQVLGTFAIISTNGPANLWMGNNPNTTGGYMPVPDNIAALDEVSQGRILDAEAKAYIKDKPGAFVLRTVLKAIKLHMRDFIASAWTREGLKRSILKPFYLPLWILANIYWFAVLSMAVAMVVIIVRENDWRGVFYLPFTFWGYVTLVHAVVVADDRYHFPAIPFIAMLAGGFLVWLGRYEMHVDHHFAQPARDHFLVEQEIQAIHTP